MVPPVLATVTAAAPVTDSADALDWAFLGMRMPDRAGFLAGQVASRLPFYVPRTGLLLLDWRGVESGTGRLRVQPRLDLHSAPWLQLPTGAIRPTGALVHVDEHAGERSLVLQMPSRRGRRGPRLPLASGLMRMSMQAHDEHVRFLPVVLRSDLAEDRHGNPSLHLHSVDLGTLQAKGVLDGGQRKQLVTSIAEQVLRLMALPGAGLARDVPMIIDADE